MPIQGLGTPEAAQSLKERAETTMERLRKERIDQASSRAEPLTEREKLRFVRGVGLRTLQLLEEAGYRSVQELAREDADRLAIRTGLGIKKARQVQQGAVHFLDSEAPEIEAARAAAQAAAAAGRRSAGGSEAVAAERSTTHRMMASAGTRSTPAAARRARRSPVRTCVGCREEAVQSELVRFVCGPDGQVVADAAGERFRPRRLGAPAAGLSGRGGPGRSRAQLPSGHPHQRRRARRRARRRG